MGANGADISRTMYNEDKRYQQLRCQQGIPWVDADNNDGNEISYNLLRRFIQTIIGDGSPDDGFKIVGDGSSNDFDITGGAGTPETAGRLLVGGFQCFLPDDTTYKGTDAVEVTPVSTGLSETVLTDSAANFTLGGADDNLSGRVLMPDITQQGNIYTITANTQTTLTVTGPILTDGAEAGDHYSVMLSTPSGADRTDEVYIDCYLDEIDGDEDPDIKHLLGTPIETQRRLKLIQNVFVAEGTTAPGNYTDSDGNKHYTLKLATIERYDGQAAVNAIDVNDDRPILLGDLSAYLSILEKWRYNIIIDTPANHGDYSTMAAYIANSPQAGDRVLDKVNEVLASTLIVPASIEYTLFKGKKFTSTTAFSPVIQISGSVKINGELLLELSHAGTIAKAISVISDGGHLDNIIVENTGAGIVTDCIYLESGVTKNYAQGKSVNSGGGSITNDLTDNSGSNYNDVTVKGDAGISRSNGAKKFDTPDIADLTNAQHDHGSAVKGGNTLNTPTIADLTNAQHDHEDAAGGGSLAKSSFSVHKDGTGQTINDSTYTKVTWPTEEFDTNNDFASSRYTPSVAGKHLLLATLHYSATLVDQKGFAAIIYKNGVFYKRSLVISSGTLGHEVNVSCIVDANGSTDYFEIYAFQDSGSSQSIHGSSGWTYFTGAFVG